MMHVESSAKPSLMQTSVWAMHISLYYILHALNNFIKIDIAKHLKVITRWNGQVTLV
jgi:hypothetical protein